MYKKMILIGTLIAAMLVCGCGGDKEESSESAQTSAQTTQSTTTETTKAPEKTAADILQENVRNAISNYGGALIKYRNANIVDNGDGSYNVVLTVHGEILPNHRNTLLEYNQAAQAAAKAAYTSSGVKVNNFVYDVVVNAVNKQTGANVDLHAYGFQIPSERAAIVQNWDQVDILSVADPNSLKWHQILH